MERKLHIGGKQRRDGWEILDVNAGPLVDHIGNAIDLGQFADDTFAEVYASHVLEHFDYKEALSAALLEWKRVLAPGGSLRLSVPDLDTLARLVVDRRLDVNQRYQVMRMIFGGHVDAHDYHLVGLNQEFLAGFLAHAGFGQVFRVAGHGLFDDTSNMVVAGQPISLNVVAVKPAVVVGAPLATREAVSA